MADGSKIEWTDATWNPITGCAIVSKGCTNCYAMKLAGTRLRHHPSRAGLTKETKAGPVWTGEVRLNEQWLDQPLRWRRPRRIFVCAHGDLFAPGVPDEWIDRVFAVMALGSHHTFQVLTKRPERMRAYLSEPAAPFRVAKAIRRYAKLTEEQVVEIRRRHTAGESGEALARVFGVSATQIRNIASGAQWSVEAPIEWPLRQVWLGVSAEDQETADQRILQLLETPAAVRFVSAEPLLGPIDFNRVDAGDVGRWDVLSKANRSPGVPIFDRASLSGAGLDWIIVGGESGPNARPMHPDWARSIRDQCQAAGVAFFFKQWGAWAPICAIGESDHLYHPAPEEHPDASRRCRHANLVMHADGAIFDRVPAGSYHTSTAGAFAQGSGSMLMFDIGKAAAGRLLDGREWSEFPVGGSR